MSDVPPDRLSNNPTSPFYDEAVLRRGVGIRFKGVEKTNVEEYCVSEGWVRVAVGKTVDRRGFPVDHESTGPGRTVLSRQSDGSLIGQRAGDDQTTMTVSLWLQFCCHGSAT